MMSMAGKKGSTQFSRRVLSTNSRKPPPLAAPRLFCCLRRPSPADNEGRNPAHLFSNFIPMYAMDFCGRAAAAIAIGPLSAS
jgi:hypothetical protein